MTTRLELASAVLLLAAAVRLAHSFQVAHAVEIGCSGQGQAGDVLLCEDFEDRNGLQLWDVGVNRDTWPRSDFVFCSNGFGFDDRCAAWTNRLVFDGSWGFWGYDAWRLFPPQNEFYVRWYQYTSDPYTWGTLEDKSVLLHDPPIATITAYVATSRNELPAVPHSGPGMPFVANYQDLDWGETGRQYTKVNRFQNQGNDITLQPGRWYLFEWYVRLNTPGASDGVTRLWIDDATEPIWTQTLRLEYDDMRWLRSSDAGKQFGFLRLSVYHQRCDGDPNTCPPNGPRILNQSQRWDHIVVSKRPIGPIPTSPPVCDAAHAVPDVLWPPNHRLVPVTIRGVTDPHHDPVTVTILSVTEGQLLDGRRDQPRRVVRRADATSDAVIQGDTVLLRAERSEHGAGRTYDVDFTARNPRGLECTGTVSVRVPHDNGHRRN